MSVFKTIDTIFNIAIKAGDFKLPIATENVDFDYDACDKGYLAAYLLPLPTTQATLGDDGCDLQSGLYQIDISYKQGKGTTKIHEKADEINAVFKSGATFTKSSISVRIKNVSIGRVNISGGFATMPLTIEYYAYTSRVSL